MPENITPIQKKSNNFLCGFINDGPLYAQQVKCLIVLMQTMRKSFDFRIVSFCSIVVSGIVRGGTGRSEINRRRVCRRCLCLPNSGPVVRSFRIRPFPTAVCGAGRGGRGRPVCRCRSRRAGCLRARRAPGGGTPRGRLRV